MCATKQRQIYAWRAVFFVRCVVWLCVAYQQFGTIYVYTHTCRVLTNDYRPWFGWIFAGRCSPCDGPNRLVIIMIIKYAFFDYLAVEFRKIHGISAMVVDVLWEGSHRPAGIVHNLCAHVHPSNLHRSPLLWAHCSAYAYTRTHVLKSHLHLAIINSTLTQCVSNHRHRAIIDNAHPRLIRRVCVCTLACVCARCVNIIVYTSPRISRVHTNAHAASHTRVHMDDVRRLSEHFMLIRVVHTFWCIFNGIYRPCGRDVASLHDHMNLL